MIIKADEVVALRADGPGTAVSLAAKRKRARLVANPRLRKRFAAVKKRLLNY